MVQRSIEECRRKAIGMLLSYKDNQAMIKVLEADLRSLDGMINSNMAVSYDQPSSGKTYKITSVVENEVISIEEKREALHNELAVLRNSIERIDIALGNMPIAQRTLLKLKYIDKLMWKQLVQYIPYSEEYIRKELKESAINILTGYLFPELSMINLFAEKAENPQSIPSH